MARQELDMVVADGSLPGEFGHFDELPREVLVEVDLLVEEDSGNDMSLHFLVENGLIDVRNIYHLDCRFLWG